MRWPGMSYQGKVCVPDISIPNCILKMRINNTRWNKDCCQEAFDQINYIGFNTTINANTLMNWNIEFRKQENFHHPNPNLYVLQITYLLSHRCLSTSLNFDKHFVINSITAGGFNFYEFIELMKRWKGRKRKCI